MGPTKAELGQRLIGSCRSAFTTAASPFRRSRRSDLSNNPGARDLRKSLQVADGVTMVLATFQPARCAENAMFAFAPGRLCGRFKRNKMVIGGAHVKVLPRLRR